MIVCIFIPFILLSLIHSWISTDRMEAMLTQNTEQMLAQVDMMLAFYMQTIENTMGIIENSPFAIDFIGGQADTDTDQNLLFFLGVIEGKHPEIAGILLVNAYGSYQSNTIVQLSRDPLQKEEWYQRAMENPKEYIVISKPLGRNLISNPNHTDDEIMSCVKAVWNPKTKRYDGVLLLDFRLSAFGDNIKNITLGSQGFLYVTDAAGKEIIYAPYNPVIYRIDNEFVLNNAKKKTVVMLGSDSYQVVSKRSSSWNIMGVFPVSDIRAVVNQIQYVTIMLFICTAALMLLFSNRINAMLIIPLGQLQTLMHSAENGNINVRFPVVSNDEIGALGNSFNQMLSEIQKLLKIIEEENKSKREAELQVLQEQIKPHFLYNTLDTINWIAMECGATEIVKLVTALTNLFRISLNKGKEFISVENEILQVKNYLIIQSIRYEEMFDYVFDVQPDVVGHSVLKLILQPLVENSIYHGIKERALQKTPFSGQVTISVKKEDDRIVLSVKDNGLGITPDRVEEINAMFASGVQTVGFGLFNVNQRLKYAFGAKYGLCLTSEEGKGTEVFVYHPVLQNGKAPLLEA